jgi:hypothetical protein
MGLIQKIGTCSENGKVKLLGRYSRHLSIFGHTDLFGPMKLHRERPDPPKPVRLALRQASQERPVSWKKAGGQWGESWWVFKGNVYRVEDMLSDDEVQLLILDEYQQQQERIERLKRTHGGEGNGENRDRIRITEHVRIEVWRRDAGRCVVCGSQEALEYDHIIPVSKGGSNTARNVELLCERHNRSKGANIG